MSEWQDLPLSEVVELVGGGTPKTTVSAYWNGDIPWLSVVDFNTGRKYVTDTEKKITKAGLENSSTKLLNAGDIILSARGTVGAMAVLSKPMTFNQSCYGLRGLANKSDTGFIYYLVKDAVEGLQQISHGGVFDTITRDTFKDITLPIPPIEEQKAIASVLSSLDDKIDLLHRQNTTLERIVETLFRQWFVEEAQEDWEEIGFGKLVTPKRGKNITKANTIDGIYPVIAGGLTPSCFHNEANTNAPVITISASGANAGFVCLHHSPVWSSDSSYIDDTITKYVYFCYVFLKYNQSILTDKQEGSAQPHIYPSHIMDMGTLDFPLDLIETFENQVKGSFNKIKLNQKQIQTLGKLRDNLLPKLMSGEVTINKEVIDGYS